MNNNKPDLKILFVHHGSFIAGGASISLINTVKGLLAHGGVTIKVLTPYQCIVDYFRETLKVEADIIPDLNKIIGKTLIGFSRITNIRTLVAVARETVSLPKTVLAQYRKIKLESPDIVHLNSSILYDVAIAARLAGVKVVWHVREIISGGKYNLRKVLAGYLIREMADKVIAISPFNAEQLGRDPDRKVRVIYNFVDFSVFDPARYDQAAEKERLGVLGNVKLIVSLGGVSFRKGTLELIEAMRYAGGGVQLLFAGIPLERRSAEPGVRARIRSALLKVENIAIDIGLINRGNSYFYMDRVRIAMEKNDIRDKNIRFIGEIPNVAPLLAACDLLVFAGTTPQFPRPIYEAWAMKRPVVAFDIDGVRQNLEHQVDGILVKERTAEALGSALNAVLASPDRMREMADKGYIKSERRFRLERNVSQIMETYREVYATK